MSNEEIEPICPIMFNASLWMVTVGLTDLDVLDPDSDNDLVSKIFKEGSLFSKPLLDTQLVEVEEMANRLQTTGDQTEEMLITGYLAWVALAHLLPELDVIKLATKRYYLRLTKIVEDNPGSKMLTTIQHHLLTSGIARTVTLNELYKHVINRKDVEKHLIDKTLEGIPEDDKRYEYLTFINEGVFITSVGDSNE